MEEETVEKKNTHTTKSGRECYILRYLHFIISNSNEESNTSDVLSPWGIICLIWNCLQAPRGLPHGPQEKSCVSATFYKISENISAAVTLPKEILKRLSDKPAGENKPQAYWLGLRKKTKNQDWMCSLLFQRLFCVRLHSHFDAISVILGCGCHAQKNIMHQALKAFLFAFSKNRKKRITFFHSPRLSPHLSADCYQSTASQESPLSWLQCSKHT